MTKIMSGSVLMRATHATHQVVAGEAILIHLNSGQYYSLNQTGTWLWEHLDGRDRPGTVGHGPGGSLQHPGAGR